MIVTGSPQQNTPIACDQHVSDAGIGNRTGGSALAERARRRWRSRPLCFRTSLDNGAALRACERDTEPEEAEAVHRDGHG